MAEAKTLSDILITIGTNLGNPTIGNLSITDQIKRAYNLLSKRTTLLILDNSESLSRNEQRDILDFLRRSPITLKLVITSRERVSKAQIIRLQGLPFEQISASLDGDAYRKNTNFAKDKAK